MAVTLSAGSTQGAGAFRAVDVHALVAGHRSALGASWSIFGRREEFMQFVRRCA